MLIRVFYAMLVQKIRPRRNNEDMIFPIRVLSTHNTVFGYQNYESTTQIAQRDIVQQAVKSNVVVE